MKESIWLGGTRGEKKREKNCCSSILTKNRNFTGSNQEILKVSLFQSQYMGYLPVSSKTYGLVELNDQFCFSFFIIQDPCKIFVESASLSKYRASCFNRKSWALSCMWLPSAKVIDVVTALAKLCTV